MKKIVILFMVTLTTIGTAGSNPYTVESAIYKVEMIDPNGRLSNLGSGVLIAPDKILTNCHVVRNRPGWPRVVHRQSGAMFRVTKHFNLGGLDACVLTGGFVGTPVRFSADFHDKEDVWIFGFPAGLPTIGQGSISGVIETDKGKSILINAFCHPGSSGGPVTNRRGELIGLSWGKVKYRNECLAIPAQQLMEYFQSN